MNVADGSEVLSPPDVPARSKGRIGGAVGATYTSSRNMFKNLQSPAQLKERRLDPKNSIHEVINEHSLRGLLLVLDVIGMNKLIMIVVYLDYQKRALERLK